MVVALEETKFPRVIEGQGEDVSTKVGAEIKDLEGSITRFVKPTSESLLKIARLPFYIWWFPHVAFSSLQLASVQTFYSVLSSTTSMIFSAPPYNFNAAQVGYMSAGLCIGATLRILYGGYFTDWAILRLSRRNKGLFEPEMRLYLLPLPAITMTIGLIVNGITTDKGQHWIYPSIGRVIFGFGNSGATDIFYTIVIDAFPNVVGQTFLSIVFFQNSISIAGSFAITTWRHSMGLTNMFITAAVVGLVINALAIPLVIWGKKSRISLTARYQRLSEADLHI